MSSVNKIAPAEVKRDRNGFWSHPDFPTWEESTCGHVINQWYKKNGITYFVSFFLETAPDDLVEHFIDTGEGVELWDPVCNREGSFLLSVHCVEDGPVAVFAVPQ